MQATLLFSGLFLLGAAFGLHVGLSLGVCS